MIWTTAALLVTLAFARVSTYPHISKSTYPIVGGITDADVDSPAVREALDFAVGKLNAQGAYMNGVVKVIKATSQVCQQPSSSSVLLFHILLSLFSTLNISSTSRASSLLCSFMCFFPQVVAGSMYRFEVEMTILGCKPWTQKMCANKPNLNKVYVGHFSAFPLPHNALRFTEIMTQHYFFIEVDCLTKW